MSREQSGGAWDEMGYQKLGGRSKNKKRTEETLKQTQAKKRAAKRENRKRGQRARTEDDQDSWA